MVYKIVYKTVAVLLALSVIPIAVFTPMVQIVGSVKLGDTYVGENLSLYDIYDFFLSPNATFHGMDDYQMTDAVRNTMPWLITAGSFLALALLLAIAIAVVCIVCKTKMPTLILSVVSGLSVIGLFRAFKAFAAPYLDGTIRIADMGIFKEGVFQTLTSALIKLELLQITTAGFLMIGAFAAVFLWTGAFMLVELGEEKPSEK